MTENRKTAAETEELDPQSLAAIRDLLASEPEIKPQSVPERVAEKQAAPTVEPQPATALNGGAARAERPRLRRVDSFAEIEPAPPAPKRRFGAVMGRLDPVIARIKGYRPPRKHVIWAAIALVVFMRPGLVFALVLLTAFIILGAFLILGYDGFWRMMMGLGRRYARRRPARAAELHEKLDRFAMRFDAFLDRFPEGSVDGLYMPDFSALAEADDKHDAAMRRRLDAMQETRTPAQG